MRICKVVGTAISSIKDERLRGFKFLVCQEHSFEGKTGGDLFLAVDTIGAGIGTLVAVVQGAPAGRAVSGNPPIDAAIVAIIDSVDLMGKVEKL